MHCVAFPQRPEPPQWGYPDSGNGYYGKRLSYGNWYDMNNGQRAQINFLEQITFIISITVISGFYYPWWAFGFIIAYWVGRLVFTMGYTKAGPNARLPGAIVMDLAMVAQFVLSVVSVVQLIVSLTW